MTEKEPNTVICVCGSEGFPYGFGGTSRITLVGKALQAAGLKFHILHCGPSPLLENTERRGVYEGISFEYTTSLVRPKNKVLRSLVYARAVLGLTFKLTQFRLSRKHIVVYLYVLSGPLNLIVGILCQLLGVSLVQEMCEWWCTDLRRSALTRWLFRVHMFKASTGLLVISKEIEHRAHERAAKINPSLSIRRLPSVVDLNRFDDTLPRALPGDNHVPNFVWCGSVDGWMPDVKFLLSAFAQVCRTRTCRLTLVGGYSDANAAIIRKQAALLGLSVTESLSQSVKETGQSCADVCLAGWVDHATLLAFYRNAAALLLPLFDDDQSRTRMPNKLGEYLASSTPVITCKVGDLQDFLVDGVNASLARPGDDRDFADRMLAILVDPEMSARIGTAGRHTCSQYLDYRAHLNSLAEFFGDCLQQPAARLRAEGSSV